MPVGPLVDQHVPDITLEDLNDGARWPHIACVCAVDHGAATAARAQPISTDAYGPAASG